MKNLVFSLSVVLGLAVSSHSMAALTELTDSEMRDVDGQIIGGGLSDEAQSDLIIKIAAGDEKAVFLLGEINRMVNDARNGVLNESNFLEYYFSHIRNLIDFGFSPDILLRQADAVLRAQRLAREQAQLDQFRREFFQMFMGQLTDFALSARNGKSDYTILVDLNKLLLSVPMNK